MHAHQQLGGGLADAIVEVRESVDVPEVGSEAPRVGLEGVERLAEQLDLDRPRRPRQIVDHVGQDLHELDAQARGGRGDLAPHLVDHSEDVAGAMARQHEPCNDVAAVLLRREQPELGPGAARRPGDLRRLGENPLGDAHDAVRLVQGRPARRPIVQHERPLVHLRQKARANQLPQPDPDKH